MAVKFVNDVVNVVTSLNFILFTCLMIVYVLISISTSVLLWQWRFRHPLKARKSKLILIFNVVGIFLAIVTCFYGMHVFETPCYFVISHLNTFYFSNFIVRGFTLWFRFEIAHESLRISDPKLQWFSNHKYLISNMSLVVYFAVILFLLSISAFVLYARAECTDDETTTWPTTISNLAFFFFGLFLSFKLKKEFDYFWIKKELIYSVTVSIIFTILWHVSLNYYQLSDRMKFDVPAFIAVCGLYWTMFISEAIPTYLTTVFYKSVVKREISGVDRNSASHDFDDTLLLVNLIEDEKACALLEDFVIREFSAENLSFFRAHQAFLKKVAECSQLGETQTCIDAAAFICRRYIGSEAPFQVNLSSEVSQKIPEDLAKLKRLQNDQEVQEFWTLCNSIFEGAQVEALNLMLTDSFIRFKKLPEAQVFIRAKKEHKALRQADLLSFSFTIKSTTS